MFSQEQRSAVFFLCSLARAFSRGICSSFCNMHTPPSGQTPPSPRVHGSVSRSMFMQVPACLPLLPGKNFLHTLPKTLLIQSLLECSPSESLMQTFITSQFSSLQFSHSVVSDSLRPHGLQHIRPPCPSPTPGVYSNLCPSSMWCHPTISSSVAPFSSCPQSLPASGSFPMSQFFASGSQSIRASASASVLPMSIQGWYPSELTGFISLQGTIRVFSNTIVQKHQFFGAQFSL